MNAKAEKNKILITGASGLLGSNLAWYFRKDNTVLGVYGQHRVAIAGVRIIGADLAQSSAVRSIMEEFEPNVVIHCAAITEIDKCEQNRKLAESVNVLAVRHVVRALKGTRTKLVHISSDAVYDGVKGQYKETPGSSFELLRPHQMPGGKRSAEAQERPRCPHQFLRLEYYFPRQKEPGGSDPGTFARSKKIPGIHRCLYWTDLHP